MVRKLTIATLLSYFLMCSSCILLKDEQLSIPKEVVHSQLRMNGYYFTSVESSNEDLIGTVFFYKDGTVLFSGVTAAGEVGNYLNNFNSERLAKHAWGVFTVNKNKIRIERWKPGFKPLKVHIYEGLIQNDTTIVLTIKTLSDETKVETYQFREFSPKPDSTNVYIK